MSSTISTQFQNNYPTAGQSRAALQSGTRRLESAVAMSSVSAATQASTIGSIVSISGAGVGLLKGIGKSVEDIAKGAIGIAADVIEVPYDIVREVARGIVHASDDGAKAVRDLGSGSAGAFASDASSAARDLFVDLPVAVGSDIAKDVKAEAIDASTLASGVLGLTSLGATGGANVFGAAA